MNLYNSDFEVVQNQAKKAATILLALGGSFGSKLIKDFEISELKRFADTASEIDEIDTNALIDFVDELSTEMSRPEPVQGGNEQTRAFLDEALPLDKFKKVYGHDQTEVLNIWNKITTENESSLTLYLLDEHPQTIAYIISNLDQDLASQIIKTLPRDLCDSVVRRLLKMGSASHLCDQIIQVNLQDDVLAQADNKAELEGRAKLAKLLNKLEKSQVDLILESMKLSLPEEAAAIRKMLFSFEDIYRLSQKDRLIMFDKIQTEKVMLALRGVTAELKEIVLSSLGARARRMIEAELTEAPTEVTKDVVAARQTIAEMALKLAAEGAIEIIEANIVDGQISANVAA